MDISIEGYKIKIIYNSKLIAKLFLFMLMIVTLNNCSGGGGSVAGVVKGVDVVVVDGYIGGANVADSNGNKAKYKSNGTYTFRPAPNGDITVTGGFFEDTGLPNTMVYTVSSSSRVISPITSFLYKNPHLKQKILTALGVDSTELLGDFVKSNSLNVAKLTQVIYIMNVNSLEDDFANALTNDADPTDMNDIVSKAKVVVTANAPVRETEINTFLDTVEAYNGNASEFESAIQTQKENADESNDNSNNESNNYSIDKIKRFSGDIEPIQLNLLDNQNIASYTLVNNPSWLSLDSNKNLKISTTEYIGAFNSDVSITFTTGETKLYENLIVGYVYPREDQLSKVLLEHKNSNKIDANYAGLNISKTKGITSSLTANYIYARAFKPNGDALVFVDYMESYWTNTSTVVYDLKSGSVINTYNYPSQTYNPTSYGINTRPKDEYTSKYLMMTQMKDPVFHLGITIYDPVTNTFTKDAFNFPDTYNSGYMGRPNLLPNGNISFSGGFAGDALGAGIIELNPYTGEKKEYHNLGTKGGFYTEKTAGDDKYIYVRTGRGTGYELIRVKKADKSHKILFSSGTIDWELVQTRYGALIKMKGQAGYDNGALYFLDDSGVNGVGAKWDVGNDKDPNCPWGPSVGYEQVFDFYPADKPTVDRTVLKPTASGKTILWYKKSNNDSWNKIEHTITTYPVDIARLQENSDGTLYIGGFRYSGHIKYDVNSEQVMESENLPLNPYATLQTSTGKTVISGYPNGRTYMIDMNKPWSRKLTEYHPTTPLPKDSERGQNPQWIFQADSVAGLKHARSMVEADGKIFITGSRSRDGSNGGGLQYSSIDDPYTILGGWHAPTENYQFHSMASVNDKYVVLSGKGVSASNLPTPTEGRLFIVDAVDGEIIRTIDPVSTSMTPGAITSVNNENEIVGMTNADGITYIYKVNIETGEIIYKKAYQNVDNRSFTIGNERAFDFKIASDGYIYSFLDINSEPFLCRIDPEIGGVEVIGSIGLYGFNIGRLAFIDNTIYVGTGNCLTKVDDVLNKEL